MNFLLNLFFQKPITSAQGCQSLGIALLQLLLPRHPPTAGSVAFASLPKCQKDHVPPLHLRQVLPTVVRSVPSHIPKNICWSMLPPAELRPKTYWFNESGHKKLHDKPITCPVQRCPHRTAKTRDMERHVIAQHPDYVKTQALPTPPRPMCPVAGCRYGQRGFARKDHLRRHLQKTHPGWLTQKVEGS